MSDFAAPLDVRTLANGDVVAKLCDGTTSTQLLSIDSSGRITVNVNDISSGTQTNDVKVTLDGEAVTLASGSEVQITDGTDTLEINTDGSINIGDISAGTQTNDVKVTLDSEAVVLGAGTATVGKVYVTDGTDDLEVNSDGSINIGDISAGTQTNDIKVTLDGEAVVLGAGTAVIGKVTISQGGNDAIVDVNGSLQVRQRAGDVWTVQLGSGVSGGEVHDFKQAAAIAATSSDTHVYTVTAGKTLLLKKIVASASARFRCELQVGPTGSLVTKAVFFGTGAAGANVDFALVQPIEVAATNLVHVIMQNTSYQAQDLYSTIIGEEV